VLYLSFTFVGTTSFPINNLGHCAVLYRSVVSSTLTKGSLYVPEQNYLHANTSRLQDKM